MHCVFRIGNLAMSYRVGVFPHYNFLAKVRYCICLVIDRDSIPTDFSSMVVTIMKRYCLLSRWFD